mmetsp:Transcript_5383/g.5547  ORF Transcript_5383/g.5547 Transcript_5383/m.5547 type:complete len:428 (+) Transcript_5383:69-1352(+)
MISIFRAIGESLQGIPENVQFSRKAGSSSRTSSRTNILRFPELKNVTKFVVMLLSQVKPEDAIRAILSNDLGSESFMKYLTVHQHHKCEAIVHSTVLVRGSEAIEEHITEVTNISANLLLKLKSVMFADDPRLANLDVVELVCESLPKFLNSEMFLCWRNEEEYQVFTSIKGITAIETTLPELLAVRENCITYEASSSNSIKRLSSTQTNASIITNNSDNDINHNNNNETIEAEAIVDYHIDIKRNILERAVDHCDQIELNKLFSKTNWMGTFITASECLPIGITLSTASHERPGYPFVFVNSYFEKMSGCKREDLIGQSCRFMQSHELLHLPNQRESIQSLYSALKHAEKVVASLTCIRSNGDFFTNVIGIKPVVDQWRSYRHVITIQIDVSQNDNIEKNRMMIKKLINILPKVSAVDVGMLDIQL